MIPALVLAALGALPAPGAGPSGPALSSAATKPQRCHRTGRRPAQVSLVELRISTRCLINRARADHGLADLTVNPKLRRVATGHSISMVRHRYFAHGSTGTRIARTGYFASTATWSFGEVIAYGCHRDGSAKLVVRRWMRSPGHRAAILTQRFREIGVGVARGDPTGGGGKCLTYTVDFGLRR
ncbi:MAG: CAP domain-containing protein [Solirubrobacterales bacterium]